MPSNIKIDKQVIAEFCKKNQIHSLAFFGSVLRDDFRPDSDVDVLVEFEQGAHIGMLKLAGLEIELSEILGYKVDINTPGFISRYFRQQVLDEAEVQYVAA